MDLIKIRDESVTRKILNRKIGAVSQKSKIGRQAVSLFFLFLFLFLILFLIKVDNLLPDKSLKTEKSSCWGFSSNGPFDA